MIAFWMLLGGAAGVRLMQSVWHILGWGHGGVSVAVPVGAVAGAAGGAPLGLITRPRLLVLLMAAFAGASAGAVTGQLLGGEGGELAGQLAGALVGGAAWAVWLFFAPPRDTSGPQPPRPPEK